MFSGLCCFKMECFTDEDCHKLVQSQFKLNADGYELVGYNFKPFDDTNISLLADYSFLTVNVRVIESNTLHECSYIIKTKPKKLLETNLHYVTKTRAFYKEPEIYNTVLKDFDNLKDMKVNPDCFLAEPEKFIILDDLFGFGYKKVDHKKEINLQHCEAALESLAKLHASTFLLENSKSKKVNELYPDVMFETLFSDDMQHPGFHSLCTAINALESIIGTYFSHFSQSVCKDAVALLRNLPFMMKPSIKYTNVFCHGNLWADNILFLYNGDGQQPIDARFVDYSLARYTPPALDVLTFLHFTTSRAFREIYQGSLLTHYYTQLAKQLQMEGLDLKQLLPWSEFEASCEHYIGTSIAASLMKIHIHLLPEEYLLPILKDVEKTQHFVYEDRSEIILSAYCNDEHYRKRLGQALVQVLEYCQFRQTHEPKSNK